MQLTTAAASTAVEPLNRYLQQIARQHIAKGISKTFVLVDEHAAAPKPVLGFFIISQPTSPEASACLWMRKTKPPPLLRAFRLRADAIWPADFVHADVDDPPVCGVTISAGSFH